MSKPQHRTTLMMLLGLLIILSALPSASRASMPPAPAIAAQSPELIADYNQGTEVLQRQSGIANFTPVSATHFVFSLFNYGTGRELYVSDGTAAGTSILYDLVPGVASGDPQHFHAIDGEAWFWAYDAISGQRQLWRTDGTPAGTHVFELAYQYVDTVVEGDALAKANARLFFVGVDAAGGAELWRSNGSTDTARVKDINPGPAGSDPREFTVAAGGLFFTAFDGTSRGLWYSDRTEVNTVLLKSSITLAELVTVGSGAYFTVQGSCGLWYSDGTAAGTRQVNSDCAQQLTDVNGRLAFVGSDLHHALVLDTPDAAPRTLFDANDSITKLWPGKGALGTDNVFIVVKDLIFDRYLYKVNLVSGATELLWDDAARGFFPSDNYFYIGYTNTVPEVGGDHYLWIYNGSTATIMPDCNYGSTWSTVQIWHDGFFGSDCLITPTSAISFKPYEFVDAPGSLDDHQFQLNTGSTSLLTFFYPGSSLYSSLATVDPVTPQVTALVTQPYKFAQVNNRYIIEAHLEHYGPPSNVFTTDGSADYLERLPIPQDYEHSFYLHDRALFTRNQHSTAPTALVWETDGTAAGTISYAIPDDLNVFNSEYPESAAIGSHLIVWDSDGGNIALLDTATRTVQETSFATDDYSRYTSISISDTLYLLSQSALWSTDGSLEGTHDLRPYNYGARLVNYGTVGDSLYIGENYANSRVHVWRATPSRTSLQSLDIITGTAHGPLIPLAQTNVLVTSAAEHGYLWRIDAAGSVLLSDQLSPSAQSAVALDQQLLLNNTDGDHGAELWLSDGSAAGTLLLSDINPGPAGSDPALLGTVGGYALFSADDGVHGRELWASDGSAADTLLLGDLYPGAESSQIAAIASVNGKLFFSANDGVHGPQLWVTDGTAAGTQRLTHDLVPGASLVEKATVIDQLLVFNANTTVYGYEPWVSDGTPQGTAMLADIMPGIASSVHLDPQFAIDPRTYNRSSPIVRIGDWLVFQADDGVHGQEFYRWRLPSALSLASVASTYTRSAQQVSIPLHISVDPQQPGPLSLTLTLDPQLSQLSTSLPGTPAVSGHSYTWSIANPAATQDVTLTIQLPEAEVGQTFVVSWQARRNGIERAGHGRIHIANQVFLPAVRR